MYPDIETLKSILLKESYISEADSKAAESSSSDSREYVEYLLGEDLINKTLIGQAIAENYQIQYVDLEKNPPTKEEGTTVPNDLLHSNRIVLVKQSGDAVGFATDTPEKVDIAALTRLFPGKRIVLAYALPDQINESFALYEQPLATRFSKILDGGTRIAPELVQEIIKDALAFRASDIHIEPHAKEVVIRFRVDGALREAGRLSKEYYENILNRIKVESGMRIDEHFLAQDGSQQFKDGDTIADLRVSLVPTVEGEKIVIRVLGSYVQSYTLADLGLSDPHRQQFLTASKKPFGMILTTGPTGSGKTTSLYSLLKLINRPDINITTIEDPVEYKIEGITQIQVSEESHMTFANGLRAIVRQDPDIILVGEIRDRETAEISVNAALTGHLVLSTFHANDASTAIPRLIEMGIEPFLLASTLEIIIAQRLVRKICTACRHSIPLTQALSEIPVSADKVKEYFNESDTTYGGAGCAVCSGTGYAGRTALYEIIDVTPSMQEIIIKSPSARDIAAQAAKENARTMFQDGLEKVKSGVTTIAELIRVVEPPESSII